MLIRCVSHCVDEIKEDCCSNWFIANRCPNVGGDLACEQRNLYVVGWLNFVCV